MTEAASPYDVFISYSHADADWVREWLLPGLEAAGLRVCVDFRDFDLGAPSLVNMERAAAASRHTLLVMTPAWVASQWADFEALLTQARDPAGRRRRLIPLLLQECWPPDRIAMLTYADFTQADAWDSELPRIVAAIRDKPRLSELGQELGRLFNPAEVKAYLEVVRAQCGRTETRPFRQLSELRGAPPRLSLLDAEGCSGVYVPLRFDVQSARPGQPAPPDESDLAMKAGRGQAERDLAQSDVNLAETLAAPGHLVFIGAAGCGKTTLLRLVATVLAGGDAGLARAELGLMADPLPLPVYVALRDFEHACATEPRTYPRDVDGLLRFVDDHFARSHPGRVPKGFLGRLVRAGCAWLLLDALDEVADFDHRIAVRQVIERLAGAFPGNRLLVTARVAAYAGTTARLDERFQVASVRDLTRDQWAPMVTRLYAGLEADGDRTAERTRRLIAHIDAAPLLQAMVRTPLMVWTATLIHYVDRDLPEQRAELYAAYVDVLMGERLHEEESAEPAQRLRDERWPMGDRLFYLTYAAYQAHLGAEKERGGRGREALVVVDEDDLVKRILAPRMAASMMLSGDERQVRRRAEREAAEFLAFMAERSGLLYPHAGGYSFGDHLTVQEFLAASYLVENVRSNTDEWRGFLRAYAGQSWWQEVFLLMAGSLLKQSEQARRFLLDELGRLPGDGDATAWGLAWAGRALLEIPPRRVGWHASARDELARRLLRVLSQNPPGASVTARIEAGAVLGRLGDPRFTGDLRLPDFVPIPAGVFWMGSDDAEVARLKRETDNDWSRETPRHQVELATFELARFPTTHAMFERFIAAGGYAEAGWWEEAITAGRWRDGKVTAWDGKRDRPAYWDDSHYAGLNQPVVGVTWYEAAAYCRWLTATLNDGYTYRLPTEAEWERAARGPTPTPSPSPAAAGEGSLPSPVATGEGSGMGANRYPWGDAWLDDHCNSKELRLERATPVGIFPHGASPEGVLDLAGNVWEWCSDWHAADAYRQRAGRITPNPTGPRTGDFKVLRGGSWYNDRNVVRCASRNWNYPDDRGDGNGFRVARSSR
ncbi:MAG: SUMF1/EgtB/PvdO family nonheme iron enzyme [Chloroflexi bacterium]|nr:SUMF1/EgtB/PvdO family nonheme iron enzyme [Chloroflexota bacterium]